MISFIRRILITVSYVTCLPVPEKITESIKSDPCALDGLSKHLTTAGLIIGFILLGAAYALHKLHAEPVLTGFVLTALWLFLTNGIHFDGLMDTADGIFSHRPPERMLEIMADSRVGNFGALAGFVVFAAKWAALSCLSWKSLSAAVLIAPAWGRMLEVMAIAFFPYAKQEGKGKVWHDTIKTPSDVVQSAFPVVFITAYLSLFRDESAFVIAYASIAIGVAAAVWLGKKLNGQTGDTYGAIVEITEAGALLALAIIF